MNRRTLYLSLALAVAAMTATAAANDGAARLSPGMRIALASDADGDTPGARRAGSADGRAEVGAFISVNAGVDFGELERLGVKIGAVAGDIVSARIPLDAVARVAAAEGVVYVDAASPVALMLDKARAAAGIPYEVPAGDDGAPVVCSGKGVVVGVIDRGFDYNHEAFLDADGVCRVSRVWEQAGSSSTLTAPEGFGYGIELATPEAIANAAGDVTGNSHGTHVAGIAAGDSRFRDGAYVGVAPDAEIVLVSMGETSGDNANLSDAIAYIFNYARLAGKPCVINMSLGAQTGPHDGTSPFDRLADSLSGPGCLLVGSAGNHGADQFHVSRTFASDDDAPLATFLQFKSALTPSNAGGTVEIWGDAGTDFAVELICYSKTNKRITETLTVDMSSAEAKEYSFAENVTGPLTVAVETNPVNGKRHVVIESGVYGLRNRYFVGVRVIPAAAGKVDIWADNVKLGLTGNDIEGYTAPGSDDSTIAEIGGTAKSVLTVGAYATRDEYTVFGTTEVKNIGQNPGDICSFSSYGPTADGRQKPEVTAPGCFVISAVSSYDNSGTQILADVNEEGNFRYGYMQGTSMAAPFVTGVVAGWLQLDPDLDPDRLREVAMATASADDFTAAGSAIRWGAGKINPRGGALALLDSGVLSVSADRMDGDGALLTPSEVVFVSGGQATVTVADLSGRVVSVSRLDVEPGDTYPLTRASLGLPGGVYILSVATPAGHQAAKLRL